MGMDKVQTMPRYSKDNDQVYLYFICSISALYPPKIHPLSIHTRLWSTRFSPIGTAWNDFEREPQCILTCCTFEFQGPYRNYLITFGPQAVTSMLNHKNWLPESAEKVELDLEAELLRGYNPVTTFSSSAASSRRSSIGDRSSSASFNFSRMVRQPPSGR